MSETEGPKPGRKKNTDKDEDTAGGSPWGEVRNPQDEQTEGAAPESQPPAGNRANPWAGGNPDEAQRRSASMDDILRARSRPFRSALNGQSTNWAVLAVAGVLAAWLAATSVHVLAQGERGVVTTFGRYTDTVGPGLHFTLPWPAQHLLRREVGKDMTILLPDKEAETLMLTRDGELIDVRLQVRWRVSDFRQFAFAFPDGEAAIRRLADAQIRAGVAELTFDEVRSGQRQADLQQRVSARLQAALDAMRAGVSIVGVEVTDNKPPARLAEIFKKIGTATDEAAKNHERAMSWANQTRYAAQAEADAFDRAYAAYQAAPAVWRTRMYHETMEKVLTNNPVALGGGTPPAPTGKAQQGKPATGGQ